MRQMSRLLTWLLPWLCLAAPAWAQTPKWAVVIDAKEPVRGLLQDLAKEIATGRGAALVDASAAFKAIHAPLTTKPPRGLPKALLASWHEGAATCHARSGAQKSACAAAVSQALWNRWLEANQVTRVLEVSEIPKGRKETVLHAVTYVPTEEVQQQLDSAPLLRRTTEITARELLRNVLEGKSDLTRRSASTQLP